jgi:hypothetical protein
VRSEVEIEEKWNFYPKLNQIEMKLIKTLKNGNKFICERREEMTIPKRSGTEPTPLSPETVNRTTTVVVAINRKQNHHHRRRKQNHLQPCKNRTQREPSRKTEHVWKQNTRKTINRTVEGKGERGEEKKNEKENKQNEEWVVG